jgi:hypothetical protein
MPRSAPRGRAVRAAVVRIERDAPALQRTTAQEIKWLIDNCSADGSIR